MSYNQIGLEEISLTPEGEAFFKGSDNLVSPMNHLLQSKHNV